MVWLIGLVLPVGAAAVEPGARALLLWDFDRGVANAWGGQYNVYMREPSWARTYLDPTVHRSPAGHVLRVTVHREEEGFCGVWMQFYPRSGPRQRFVDAAPYRFLSFWIKGEKGGEDFEVQLVDDAGVKREGANPRLPLQSYLAKGVTTEWQEVVIPLADFQGLNLRRLAQMTLNFSAPGDYRFYLSDIALKPSRSAQVARPTKTAAKPPSVAADEGHRATWMWNARRLFESPEREQETKRFFDFCAAARIAEVYLALDLNRSMGPSGPQYDLRNPERYQEFLERAHQQGLTVDGLGGTPEWAARENHAFALAAVDAVLAFNRSVPPAARFDGVHFDVEPYSLVGFVSSEYRSQLLADFVKMISECAARVRAEPKMRFSCDVPWWFYPTDRLEQHKLTVSFRGVDKPVGEHLTDLLDSVTIMDYSDRADGARGIIAGGSPALAYAAAKRKKIVVGLETSVESESTVYFVCGLPIEEFLTRLASSEIRAELFLGGFRMSTLAHETHVHIGLSAPADLSGAKREAFFNALAGLARQFSATSDPERFPVEPILEEARQAIEGDPEWKGFETFEFADPETQRPVKGFRSVHRMPRNTTFYGLGREVFNEETLSAVEWLRRYPSFGGFAIHYYETYRDLMEGK